MQTGTSERRPYADPSHSDNAGHATATAEDGPIRRRAGPLLIVVTGPTGAGKDTVVKELLRIRPGVTFVSTWTTRPRTERDAAGLPYHHVTAAEFDAMRRRRGFIEFNDFGEKKYGSPRAPVRAALAEGNDTLFRIDPNGAATFRRKVPGVVTIFLTPPSLDHLRAQLEGRDPPEEVTKRLPIAAGEFPRAHECHYLVVNQPGAEGIYQAALEINAIMTAEHCRLHRRRVVV